MSAPEDKADEADHGDPDGWNEGSRSGIGRRLIVALPLLVFAVLAVLFLLRLESGRNAQDIPSALIGTRAPALALAPLEGVAQPALDDAAIRGRLTLVNVFASWCVPCRQEHPLILGLSKDPRLQVVGINYKDQPDKARAFLDELGNPYAAIGTDPKGRAAIDWGVYGIPESFLVSPEGIILYKRIGPFDDEAVRKELEPAIVKALGGGT
ncbi:DsbE family thiol:disulfide interchange protein [Rhizobium rhizosphaerae]|uniref:DsbE family thiol:disulfide interchange protein n=1 Tax=Xaviernesmea rhizosphaerae TaxID=1672749 RepID=UPI0009BF361B|nr:DsbE family thiol:disulfide interchange protein [Xaviernesmea rhizosphaerae]